MSKVEQITAIRATPAQAMRALVTTSRLSEWVAPDVTLTPRTRAATLSPGDQLRLEIPVGAAFDYVVEAATDREVVFSFSGPWSGEERWSFIADGAETLVRRVYDVRETHGLAGLAWPTIGRAMVIAHYKLEMMRFRDMVERNPGRRAKSTAESVRCALPTTSMRDESAVNFSSGEEREIKQAAQEGRTPLCPRCQVEMSSRMIGGGSFGLGYARRREWLICGECRRSVIFDRKRGTRT